MARSSRKDGMRLSSQAMVFGERSRRGSRCSGLRVRVSATFMSRRMMSRGCMVMPLPPHHAIASTGEAVLNDTLLILVACCRSLGTCGNAAHPSPIGHAVLRCAVGVSDDASEGRAKESAGNGTSNGLSGPVPLCSELLAGVEVYEVFVMRLAAGGYIDHRGVSIPAVHVLRAACEHEGGG